MTVYEVKDERNTRKRLATKQKNYNNKEIQTKLFIWFAFSFFLCLLISILLFYGPARFIALIESVFNFVRIVGKGKFYKTTLNEAFDLLSFAITKRCPVGIEKRTCIVKMYVVGYVFYSRF